MHLFNDVDSNRNLPKAVLATGRYLGEGFDDERLDTLFLTLPISWKGTLNQYAGRLHRIHHSKKKVMIYDYVDLDVPVLARMYDRRLKGYRSIGYFPFSRVPLRSSSKYCHAASLVMARKASNGVIPCTGRAACRTWSGG